MRLETPAEVRRTMWIVTTTKGRRIRDWPEHRDREAWRCHVLRPSTDGAPISLATLDWLIDHEMDQREGRGERKRERGGVPGARCGGVDFGYGDGAVMSTGYFLGGKELTSIREVVIEGDPVEVGENPYLPDGYKKRLREQYGDDFAPSELQCVSVSPGDADGKPLTMAELDRLMEQKLDLSLGDPED